MKNAFTLIEAIIVISVMMLLVGLSSLNLVSFGRSSNLETAKAVVVSSFREAQSNSLANLGDVAWGVHFDANRAVIYADSGTGYNFSDSSNRFRVLPSGVNLTSTFTGGNTLFIKGKTSTDNSGAVTLSLPPQTSKIIINSEGMIDDE